VYHHNKELHDSYFSPSTIRMMKSMKMGWACSTLVQRGMHIEFLGGKPEQKGSLRKYRCEQEDNIKMNLR
jgi:hypothetical protein